MARRLGNTPFMDLLPANLARDMTISAAAAALDAALKKSVLAIPGLLLFARLANTSADAVGLLGPLARLAELAGGLTVLPEDVLDLIAWQLHVDGYEASQTYETKRRMVYRSLMLHRHKGTPWAVAEALRSIGYADARIIEGGGICRYDGEILYNGTDSHASGNRWALFDVEVDIGEDQGVSSTSVTLLRSAVEAWKNARSHLRAISWVATVNDEVPLSDVAHPLRVLPDLEDVREWGFPLYNGAINYNNGYLLQYNGDLLHGGTNEYQSYKASGHTHNTVLDALTTNIATYQEDVVRFTPQYDAALTYNGGQHHGPSLEAFAEQQDLFLHAINADALAVTETTAIQVISEDVDNIGVYHDASLSYGQQRIRAYNNRFAHDGNALFGPYKNNNFYAVRYDGHTNYNNSAAHSLWGWQAGSAQAPTYTYSALSDAYVLRAGQMDIQDTFNLDDTCSLTLRKFRLYNGAHGHDGAIHYDVQEEAYEI